MTREGKGGKREQIFPEEFVRAKGMGMRDHYITLKFANNITSFSTQDLLEFCNIEFGRFGNNSRDETCRSWCKELWRYGWLEQIDSQGNLVELNATNWENPPKNRKFRITDEGKRVIKLPKEYFMEEVACAIVRTSEDGVYPQCKKFLDASKNGVDCPIDYTEGPNTVGVVKDSYKAITFGDLEPTGIIFRKDTKNWGLHQEYLEKLRLKNERDRN